MIKGPTESRKITEAIRIIQIINGMRKSDIPRVRMLNGVTRKLIPPMRKATNSSASARSHMSSPQLTPVYSTFADSGG